MLLVCYDLQVWHFLISVNILNNKNITIRSIGSSSSFYRPSSSAGECLLQRLGGDRGSVSGHDIPKLLKWCSLGTHLRGRARTGRPSIRIMWLDVVSCQVSGAWYFSEAVLKRVHCFLSQPDTVVIWLNNCWKRRLTRTNKQIFQFIICVIIMILKRISKSLDETT